jgi:hypothetical protein
MAVDCRPLLSFISFNLKAAVEREKAVQAIDVHREWKNCVVTLWVMSQLFHFLGASRGCADFRDPTAVSRFNLYFSSPRQSGSTWGQAF